jgi:hypothetical protein
LTGFKIVVKVYELSVLQNIGFIVSEALTAHTKEYFLSREVEGLALRSLSNRSEKTLC